MTVRDMFCEQPGSSAATSAALRATVIGTASAFALAALLRLDPFATRVITRLMLPTLNSPCHLHSKHSESFTPDMKSESVRRSERLSLRYMPLKRRIRKQSEREVLVCAWYNDPSISYISKLVPPSHIS